MKKTLIIGGGIAGSLLAIQLMKRGVGVTLLDRGTNHSSAVASGMVNPMVFRRMNLSWRVDEMLPYARDFYLELEDRLKAKFYNTLRIRRFFSSEQERGYWEKKQHEAEYQKYLTLHDDFDEKVPLAKSEFGSGIVKNAFWIRSKLFMEKMHLFLKEQKVLQYGQFEPAKFALEELSYGSSTYDAVVFCCGSDNDKIPYFNQANIQHNRGQILHIESSELSQHELWNRKGFILPTGGEKFMLGATYEWNEPSLNITAEAREKLEGVFKTITNASYKVNGQTVGMRPTVSDRRPIMGEHPDAKGLFIFNGLGTKGYMLAPLLSLEMAQFMTEGKALHEEVVFSRVYK
tara:strand:+ start:863 stop:1900 length:1038 start_codon:yes stop_codon:yes gene_type:complete